MEYAWVHLLQIYRQMNQTCKNMLKSFIQQLLTQMLCFAKQPLVIQFSDILFFIFKLANVMKYDNLLLLFLSKQFVEGNDFQILRGGAKAIQKYWDRGHVSENKAKFLNAKETRMKVRVICFTKRPKVIQFFEIIPFLIFTLENITRYKNPLLLFLFK